MDNKYEKMSREELEAECERLAFERFYFLKRLTHAPHEASAAYWIRVSHAAWERHKKMKDKG